MANGPTVSVAAPSSSDWLSTTSPSTEAVTVPLGSTPVAETVTAIADVPSLTSTEAGVGVAVMLGVALVTVTSTLPCEPEWSGSPG